LTITLGIWLANDTHYSNALQLASQNQLFLETVDKFKDYPSLLIYIIVNEGEIYVGDNDTYFAH
jgi:hypothetical protein